MVEINENDQLLNETSFGETDTEDFSKKMLRDNNIFKTNEYVNTTPQQPRRRRDERLGYALGSVTSRKSKLTVTTNEIEFVTT